MSKISVVVIEDHELSRIGLCAALRQYKNIDILGDAPNATKGLEIITSSKPDVAIVDIGLPDKDGIELTQELKQSQETSEDVRTKILILTMHKDEDAVMAAFAAGADSYSVKDASVESLVQAIETTNEGNSWIDPTIARVVLKQSRQPKPSSTEQSVEIKSGNTEDRADYEKLLETYPLTDREMEVLELIVAGCSNAEIAEKLYITVGTVKTHVRNILGKLCADDRTQAAVRALRSGLID
ncbi:MAG: response regulator transcription factor [Prochloraceae cyanobacterium]|nr:response regulator transcription factor [Prochloraceae cyanobacterium]